MPKYLFNSFAFIVLFCSSSADAIELFDLENSSGHEVRSIQIELSSEPDLLRALSNGIVLPDDIEGARIKFRDLSGALWKLDVFQSLERPTGPTIFVPHDNENESFQSGMRSLIERGGHLLALECDEKRLCSGIDPNRNFKKGNEVFLDTILRFFQTKPFPVITLHNNHDSHHELGGRGSIYADLNVPYADGRGFYFGGDADDLIIFADSNEMANSQLFKRFSRAFEERQLNFIFEEITSHNSLSGHMSTYVLLNTTKAYFNIESQHGHESEQVFYLNQFFETIM